MNKTEFMNQLNNLLYRLPNNERITALNFYAEYFDDAGIENEQSVIKELGSPQRIARQILSESSSRFMPDDINLSVSKEQNKSIWSILLLLFLLIIFSPILITAVCVIFSLLLVVFALIGVFILLTIVFIIAGIYGLFGWFAGIGGIFIPGISLPAGIFGLGIVLSLLGLGLLMLWPCIWLVCRGIPLLFQSVIKLFHKKDKIDIEKKLR